MHETNGPRATFAFWQLRRGLIGAVAAVSALQIFGPGPFAWHFAADAVRIFTFLQLFAMFGPIKLLGHNSCGPALGAVD